MMIKGMLSAVHSDYTLVNPSVHDYIATVAGPSPDDYLWAAGAGR